MSNALLPKLEELRQAGYYRNPRFHVSVAWVLTRDPTSNGFPNGLCSKLNDLYGDDLRNIPIEVDNICIKIGKTVDSWMLGRQ